MKELRRQLADRVNSHPANRGLNELKAQAERDLENAIQSQTPGQTAALRWRIRKIAERMESNCAGEFAAERAELQKLKAERDAEIAELLRNNSEETKDSDHKK